MRRLFPALFLLLAAALAGGALALSRPLPEQPPDDDLGAVADFALTERDGRTVTRADLLGKVWVAAFSFTRCKSFCPQISGTMARLQHELAGRPDVRLVTFDVDPDHDTPAVLRQYADAYQADPGRWLVLTGDRAQVYDLVLHSFHVDVQQTEGAERRPGNEVIHSSRLALVDRRGHIRGYFEGRSVDDEGKPVDDVPRLVARVDALLGERP